MSWDVLIVNRGGRSGSGVDDEPTGPLGSPDEVRSRVSSALPGVDWSEPAWGVYETDEYTIEFDVGDDDVVNTVMIRITGGGDIAPDLVRLAQTTAWSLLDTTSGEYLDPTQPSTVSWDSTQAPLDDELTGEVQTSLAEATEAPAASDPHDSVANDDTYATLAESMSGASEPQRVDRASPEPAPAEPVAPVSELEPDEDEIEIVKEEELARPKASPKKGTRKKTTPAKAPKKAAPAKQPSAKKKAAKKTVAKKAPAKKAPAKKAPSRMKKGVVKKKAVLRAKAAPKKKAAKAAKKATRPAKKVARMAKKATRTVKKAVRAAKRVVKKAVRKAKKK
jgi:hypothetical protein